MKTMDIRLKHKDIKKNGTDSFERKSVDNSFDIEFDSLDSTHRQLFDAGSTWWTPLL